jgi:hypothetical protein
MVKSQSCAETEQALSKCLYRNPFKDNRKRKPQAIETWMNRTNNKCNSLYSPEERRWTLWQHKGPRRDSKHATNVVELSATRNLIATNNFYDHISQPKNKRQNAFRLKNKPENEMRTSATLFNAKPTNPYIPPSSTSPSVKFCPRLEAKSKLASELGHLVQWDGTTINQ